MRQVIRKVFDWKENTEYGDGWVIRGMDGFYPVGGNGFAHDCLEHLDETVGIEAEMRAFGSILWVRGITGYFEQYGSRHGAAYNMASDITQFLTDSGLKCEMPVDFHTSPQYGILEDGEGIITEILSTVIRDIPGEFESQWDKEIDKEKLSQSLGAVCAWIRFGYRQCERRYGKWSTADQMAWIYSEIVKAFDKNFSIVGDVGESLEFKYNIQSGRWSIRKYGESKYVNG